MASCRSIPGGSFLTNQDIIDTETGRGTRRHFIASQSLSCQLTTPHEKKEQVLHLTLQGLDSVSSADVLLKLTLLDSTFEFSNLPSEINASPRGFALNSNNGSLRNPQFYWPLT
jgi:hypothetical protein